MPTKKEPYTISGKIRDETTNEPVSGLTVKAFDAKHQSEKDFLGKGETDADGRFIVQFRKTNRAKEIQKVLPKGGPRMVLKVIGPSGLVLHTTRPRAGLSRFREREIPVDLINVPRVTLQALLEAARIRETRAVSERLHNKGIGDSVGLLGAIGRLNAADFGVSDARLHRLLLVAKLHAVSGSLELAGKLGKLEGFRTLAELGAVPKARLKKELGELDKEECDALDRLLASSGLVRREVVDLAAANQRRKSRDALWHPGSEQPGIPELDKEWSSCKDCDPWQNVFSPRAYLFDLLDLIYFTWGLTTADLEGLLLQDIDDLGEERANASVPQVEIAVEVLEKFLDCRNVDVPIHDQNLANRSTAEWTTLLGLGKRTLQDILKNAENHPTYRRLASWRLAHWILETPMDLGTVRKIRDLLRSGADSGHMDASIAEVSPSYEQGGSAFAASLAATYAKVLTLYRDALIKHSGERHLERLPDKLFIDLQAQPCGETNRLTQLIMSLQSFILAVRSGDIERFSRDDLPSAFVHDLKDKPAIPVEDSDWRWLQDFQTWASAMYTLLYPENVLTPPLHDEGHSEAFEEAQKGLASGTVDLRVTLAKYTIYLFHWYMPVVLKKLADNKSGAERQAGREAAGGYPVSLNAWIGICLGEFLSRHMAARGRSLDQSIELICSELSDPMWWMEQFDELHDCLVHVTGSETHNYPEKPPRNECFPWEYPTARRYQEAFLHFPLLAAWALNRSGEYAAAHDWYRRLYDPMRSRGQRHVFPFEQYFNDNTIRSEQWWDDVLDARQIAERRTGVYLRHTILAMVKNLLDWADHEYALAKPETIDRARQLYELARRVLQAPDLADHCGRTIRELELDIVTDVPEEIPVEIPDLRAEADRLRPIVDPDILRSAVKDFGALLPSMRGPGDIDPVRDRVTEALSADRAIRPLTTLGQQHAAARTMLASYEDELFFSGMPEPGLAMAVTHAVPENVPFFFRMMSSRPLNLPVRHNPGGAISTSVTFCVPANPLLKVLSFYIEVSLIKLRNCLSIAGEPLPPASLPTTASDVIDAMTNEAARGTSHATMNLAWDVPRYRYAYMADKARQYTDIAQRLGSALLLAYEKREEEGYRQLLARQGLDLAEATITLKGLAVTEAETAKKVAEAQEDRAETQRDFWKVRIEAGMMSGTETAGLGLMAASSAFQLFAGMASSAAAFPALVVAMAGGVATAGGIAATVPSVGTSNVATLGGILALAGGLASGGQSAAAALSSFGAALGTAGQATLTFASFERRWEDWTLQKDLSIEDVKIAGYQVDQANDRIAIADQEQQIARLQETHAEETLRFLETEKFSNDKLYVWMIDVLGASYRSVMQIAASVARQAQSALEFERQQAIEIITGDYWSLAASGVPTSNLSEEQRASGLLGAERLLTDLTKLDAYKVATDRRRHQLSKTISMAQTMPGELVALRTRGAVTFNTLMDWFDLDFPGHYMRLIKSVRVSVLCLASQVDGIHAMLHNGGESSVVVRDLSGLFTKQRAFRVFPESIALDAPYNESGLFVLDYNDPMYLPFEGLGVETQWTLELPRATNRFNFDSIMDVMLTIEYTAYHDPRYAIEVRKRFKEPVKMDVMRDLRTQYPDEWYHFKNPMPGVAVEEQSIKVKLEPRVLPCNVRVCEGATGVNVYHITLLAVADATGFGDDADLSAITVAKEGEDIALNAPVVQEERQLALLSTRAPGVSPDEDNGIASDLTLDGSWVVTVPNSLVAQIADLVLIVTVEGCLDWPV